MRKIKINSVLVFSFSILFIGNISGQYDADAASHGLSLEERSEIAVEAVTAIKDGVLIVRLASESRKIEEIDKLIDNPDIEETKRTRLEALKLKTIEDAAKLNQGICEGFKNYYEFSDFLFLYDTSVHYLDAGIQSGYFLNENLEVDTSINLDNRTYRLVRFGWPFNSGSLQRSFFVMDTEYKDLQRPFPNGIRTGEWLASLVNGPLYKDPWKYNVNNFERKLNKFYYKWVSRPSYKD